MLPLLLVLLPSCAARMAELVPQDLVLERHHAASVRVNVKRDVPPANSTDISAQMFSEAVQESLRKTQLFASIALGPEADYTLLVDILNVSMPGAGLDMTSTFLARWQVTRAGAEKPVFEEFLETSHTATTGDAFAGGNRARMAIEQAARENIAEGLRRISALESLAPTP